MNLAEEANELWKRELPGRSALQLSHEMQAVCRILDKRIRKIEERLDKLQNRVEGHID